MLILVVVIAILATNLFLGFFVAHYLGYGPQNFQELWTGVYLRPVGSAGTGATSRSLDAAALEALTKTAIDRLTALDVPERPPVDPALQAEASSKDRRPDRAASEHLPTRSPAGPSTSSPPDSLPDSPTWTDAEVVKTIWRSQLVWQHAVMVSDRWRLLELAVAPTTVEWPEGTANPGEQMLAGGTGAGPASREATTWDAAAVQAVLERCRRSLQAVVWVEPVTWWRPYLKSWEHVQNRWQAYLTSLESLARLQVAEQAFHREHTAVVCENGTCRRVGKATAKSQWWQRPSAELRTLAWVHQQRDRLYQELFDHFSALRKAQREWADQTLFWMRETFRAELLRETANELGLFADAWASNTLIEEAPQSGYLLVLRRAMTDVAEFLWGSTVVAAYREHLESRLQQWQAEIRELGEAESSGEMSLALQHVDQATIALWVPAPGEEEATLTAWTVVNAWAGDCRQVGGQPVDLPFRAVLVPLTAKRTAAAALEWVQRRLDPPDRPIWEPDVSPVWRWEQGRLRAVARPESVPCLPQNFDLVAWFTGHEWAGVPGGGAGLPGGGAERQRGMTRAEATSGPPGPVADLGENADNGSTDPAGSSATTPEDDGIEW